MGFPIRRTAVVVRHVPNELSDEQQELIDKMKELVKQYSIGSIVSALFIAADDVKLERRMLTSEFRRWFGI